MPPGTLRAFVRGPRAVIAHGHHRALFIDGAPRIARMIMVSTPGGTHTGTAPAGSDSSKRELLLAAAARLRSEVSKRIVGQERVMEEVLMAMLAGGHALLVGVPGLAKTLMIRSIAEAMRLDFRRIQFTPDLVPSDITGTEIMEEDTATGARRFRFVRGPIFANIVLADEINRTPPRTQAALLEAMQERRVTVDGVSHQLSEHFTVFATQNPVEFEGTYPLPEAELDRFMLKVLLGYPEAEVEQGILSRVVGGFEADEPESYGIERVLEAGGLGELRRAARRVRAEPSLLAYVTAVVRATREAPSLTLGASPRAGVALLKVSQAAALMDGRSYVVPDDVKALAPAVLRHRIAVAPELELEGVSADAALRAVLERIEVPR